MVLGQTQKNTSETQKKSNFLLFAWVFLHFLFFLCLARAFLVRKKKAIGQMHKHVFMLVLRFFLCFACVFLHFLLFLCLARAFMEV